ncbi:hypothetical protein [Pelotomaculum terephthalicicum]|uniref:hypothetical protein n=1 Tax=Pelotomaculum terephthalicicum TaxID=206393 RepID=UPI0035E3DBBE
MITEAQGKSLAKAGVSRYAHNLETSRRFFPSICTTHSSVLEVVKTFAIFRFILPDTIIRPAGGREINLRDMQGFLMLSGANGLIIGNYLTFSGRDAKADFRMAEDAGLYPL